MDTAAFVVRTVVNRVVISVLTLIVAALPNYVSAQSRVDETSYLFLPLVASDHAVVEPPKPIPCQLNQKEQEFGELLVNDPNQERPSLTCHGILARAARERAEDMAQRDYFGHVNPDGYGPNYLVIKAGYILPEWYDKSIDVNNIESIAAGWDTASATWLDLVASESHRTHLLGDNSFYAAQVEFGIGYAYNPDSEYEFYWVVITAEPGP